MATADGSSLPTKVSAFAGKRVASRELPLVSLTDFDNVELVKAAIRGLEMGYFEAASRVVDAMGRDDRIYGCLEKRTRALPALQLFLEPRGDGRQKKAVADELDEQFDTFYSDASLSELGAWGLMLGFGLAQNLWEYSDSRWTPRLKVWHPRAVTWDHTTNSFWVSAVEGRVEVKPGDGQWVVYCPYGDYRGWMQGRVRALYVPWLIRTWGLRDWARYSEVHGLPIRKAVTPATSEEADKQRFLEEIAKIGSESVIRTPRTAQTGTAGDVDRFDLELLEAKANSWEGFERLLDKAEACIAINILGQNLSTEVKGGSYAATASHLQIEERMLRFDSKSMGQCLRRQSLSWWALLNFGNAELAPLPRWKTKTKSPEESTAKGAAFKNLGEGLNALKLAGVQVDVDKIMEDEDIPVLGPAEVLSRQDITPPPPTGQPGGGGAPAKGLGGNAPLPRPKALASQVAEEVLPAAAVEGQAYVDAVADDGAMELAGAMAADLAEVAALIRDSPDFTTLRHRLIEKYREMDPTRMAQLLHRGMLMAALAGHYAVKQETT